MVSRILNNIDASNGPNPQKGEDANSNPMLLLWVIAGRACRIPKSVIVMIGDDYYNHIRI